MRRNNINSSSVLAGRVRRCHVLPVIHRETVGEHEARVANVYVEVFGLPRAEVLYYCLNHDKGELFAGDTPASAKWDVPSLKTATDEAETIGRGYLGILLPQLTEQEFRRVKTVDILALWEFGCTEMHMGNRYARPLVVDCRRVAIERAKDNADEDVVLHWIQSEERRYAEA